MLNIRRTNPLPVVRENLREREVIIIDDDDEFQVVSGVTTEEEDIDLDEIQKILNDYETNETRDERISEPPILIQGNFQGFSLRSGWKKNLVARSQRTKNIGANC